MTHFGRFRTSRFASRCVITNRGGDIYLKRKVISQRLANLHSAKVPLYRALLSIMRFIKINIVFLPRTFFDLEDHSKYCVVAVFFGGIRQASERRVACVSNSLWGRLNPWCHRPRLLKSRTGVALSSGPGLTTPGEGGRPDATNVHPASSFVCWPARRVLEPMILHDGN